LSAFRAWEELRLDAQLFLLCGFQQYEPLVNTIMVFTNTTLTRCLIRQLYEQTDFSVQHIPQSKTAPVGPQKLHIFWKKISASSDGVVETLAVSDESNTREIVQIIHRTVEFSLDKRGWSDLLITEYIVRPHYPWLQACTKLLQNFDLASAFNHPEFSERSPFESYLNVAESSSESSFLPQFYLGDSMTGEQWLNIHLQGTFPIRVTFPSGPCRET